MFVLFLEKFMKLPDDQFILELLPEFVDTWIVDIEAKFDEYYNAKDEAEMYRFAHTLKGSCFQFSLDHIAEMGIELMGKVREHQWSEIGIYKTNLLAEFQKARQFLKDNNIQ